MRRRRRRSMALAVVDDGGPEELQHNFNVERRCGRKRKDDGRTDGRTGGLADRQQRDIKRALLAGFIFR